MRKQTPDILGALMGETVKQESNNSISKEVVKEIKARDSKAISTQPLCDSPEEPLIAIEEPFKEKATFNLSKQLLAQLEDKRHEIRKLFGSKQISKTLIVEEALRIAFAEFDLNRETSKFYGSIANNKSIKQ